MSGKPFVVFSNLDNNTFFVSTRAGLRKEFLRGQKANGFDHDEFDHVSFIAIKRDYALRYHEIPNPEPAYQYP